MNLVSLLCALLLVCSAAADGPTLDDPARAFRFFVINGDAYAEFVVPLSKFNKDGVVYTYVDFDVPLYDHEQGVSLGVLTEVHAKIGLYPGYPRVDYHFEYDSDCVGDCGDCEFNGGQDGCFSYGMDCSPIKVEQGTYVMSGMLWMSVEDTHYPPHCMSLGPDAGVLKYLQADVLRTFCVGGGGACNAKGCSLQVWGNCTDTDPKNDVTKFWVVLDVEYASEGDFFVGACNFELMSFETAGGKERSDEGCGGERPAAAPGGNVAPGALSGQPIGAEGAVAPGAR
jgi:hypothetical protein